MSVADASPSSALYERAGLTEKQREALDLYDGGMGVARIASTLGVHANAVRCRLEGARIKLRKARAQKDDT